MEINTISKEEATVVSLEGNLDGTTAEFTQEKLLQLLTPNCELIIDMAKCPYVSSAGLRVLLMTAKQLTRIGGAGVFAGLSEEVRDVMEMTGFSSIFESYGTVDEAHEAMKRGTA